MTDPISFGKAKLSEEEVAAIAAVLAAAAQEEQLRQADDRPLAGGWKSYYRTLRPTLVSGREAWRTHHRL